jgi:hypothetical protein
LTRVEDHSRDNSGSLGEAVATPDLSSPRLDFSLRRGLAPAIAKAMETGGRDVTREATPDAMDLGPVPAPNSQVAVCGVVEDRRGAVQAWVSWATS